MFNYLLFDFDNTLYNYDVCYKESLKCVFNYLLTTYNITNNDASNKFKQIKIYLQNTIINNAASHNKLIQFKKLCEYFNLPLDEPLKMYELFINEFNKHLILYDHVELFLQFCLSKNIKLYILTNNLCYEQLNRLKTLDILKYFNKIYTSEEFGCEKPDPKIFSYILLENNINKNEIAMIGDSYKMDIESVNLMDIYAFHFENKSENRFEISKDFTVFDKYHSLLNFFTEYYNESTKFIRLSKFCGERYDLVQAGGGNISFKLDSLMFIKSSGSLLSDIIMNKNYVGINYSNIINNLQYINNETKKIRENDAKSLVDKSVFTLKDYKPSIETTMHALTHKYTAHIHPLQFLIICGLDNCYEILTKNFTDFCFIDYFTPGIDVATELTKRYKKEEIIFMKNHGIVITSNSIERIYTLIDNVTIKLELISNLNYTKYKNTNYISHLMNKINNHFTVSYLSCDTVIHERYNQNINLKPFYPDKLVYCGTDVVKLENNEKIDSNHINSYIEKYNNEIPKIFELHGELYINSTSIKKCIEIESLLKSHILSFNYAHILLSNEENQYLNNWDAEKYRQHN